jgi:hypothetical protein
LEGNQVRSTVFKERKKAANVGPLISVEAEDGETRG